MKPDVYAELRALQQKMKELATENSTLRKTLADSNLNCIYCKLPKADIVQCRSGFPGCGRMDDILCAETGNAEQT